MSVDFMKTLKQIRQSDEKNAKQAEQKAKPYTWGWWEFLSVKRDVAADGNFVFGKPERRFYRFHRCDPSQVPYHESAELYQAEDGDMIEERPVPVIGSSGAYGEESSVDISDKDAAFIAHAFNRRLAGGEK